MDNLIPFKYYFQCQKSTEDDLMIGSENKPAFPRGRCSVVGKKQKGSVPSAYHRANFKKGKAMASKSTGYVHVWRDFRFSEIWKRGPLSIAVWMYFLLNANGNSEYCPKYHFKESQPLRLKRGQLVFTYPKLRGSLSDPCSIPTLKRTVYELANGDDPDIRMESIRVNEPGKKSHPAVLITIRNYDHFNPQNQAETVNAETDAETDTETDAEKNAEELEKEEDTEYEIEDVNAEADAEADAEMNGRFKEVDSKEVFLNNSLSFAIPHEDDIRPKLLSLDEDTPTNRWLKAYHNNRPQMHPLQNLTVGDMQDARSRVDDFLDWVGEECALQYLQAIFTQHPKPVSVKQAVMQCQKKHESVERTTLTGEKGNGSYQNNTRSRSRTRPIIRNDKQCA